MITNLRNIAWRRNFGKFRIRGAIATLKSLRIEEHTTEELAYIDTSLSWLDKLESNWDNTTKQILKEAKDDKDN